MNKILVRQHYLIDKKLAKNTQLAAQLLIAILMQKERVITDGSKSSKIVFVSMRQIVKSVEKL